MPLNERLDRYRRMRSFDSPAGTWELLQRKEVFHRTKRIYFDEVENANVWSFYLVERDLHHTFEEFVISLDLPPYAIWSKQGTNAIKDARVTFPISETAAVFKDPVPTAGMTIEYVLEVLHVGKSSAVIGFLGFVHGESGAYAKTPSVVAAWLRVLVEYNANGTRSVIPLPDEFKARLEKYVPRDPIWT